MKWEPITLDEQETILNFDYYDKAINIYTSRSIVYNKLLKKIGEPTKLHINYDCIYGADWVIPFSERTKISKALTLANLLMTKERK